MFFKKVLISFCFLLLTFFSNAQRQGNTWYFGNKVGLDFNQSSPIGLTNGVIGAVEGCTVISDINGSMLFYSNGLNVINRKQQQMKNGDSLMGDLGSTNNALVVPLPGNDSIYYLFTVGAQNQSDKGFRYNVINMKRDSGFGEVIQKNIQIEDQVFEKLAAVKHCNNKDIWVTIRKWNTDEYHSYLITSSGINPVPVVSHTGFMPTNPIGTLKFSCNGKKLVAVYSFETNKVELMNFDNTTGLSSGSILFQPEALLITDGLYMGAYGAEFSPNCNLLYISANLSDTVPCALYQYDVSSNNAATIIASKQIITKAPPWMAGGLQIAPDQKIYMSLYKDTSVSVISNPDIPGYGCNFVYNKIFLGQKNGTPVQIDMPNFIQSYFDPRTSHDFTRTGNCLNKDITFSINNTIGIDSVKWDFGDGQKSQALSPTNHYANPGTYIVNLIVYNVNCSSLNDTINHTIWIDDSAKLLGADTGSCALISFQIGINDIAGANYLWNNGSTTNKIIADSFGLYKLTVEQNGCTLTDSMNVFQKPTPVVNISGDTSICFNKNIILTANSTSANSYLWNTGETSASIMVNKAGKYIVTVTGNSCLVSDSVLVKWGDCEAFVPTAFTPNHDGLNDKFGVAAGFAAIDFSMRVFDRWGNLIFMANDNTKKWDGTFKGKAQPNGAYPWIISYTNMKGHKIFMQGTVLLIR